MQHITGGNLSVTAAAKQTMLQASSGQQVKKLAAGKQQHFKSVNKTYCTVIIKQLPIYTCIRCKMITFIPCNMTS